MYVFDECEPDETCGTGYRNVPGDDYDEPDVGPDRPDYGGSGESWRYEYYVGSGVGGPMGAGVGGEYGDTGAGVIPGIGEGDAYFGSVWTYVVDDTGVGSEYVCCTGYVSTVGYVPDDDWSVAPDE